MRNRKPPGRPCFALASTSSSALRAWRKREAELQGLPAYMIFSNETLASIARMHPQDAEDLAMIPGVGRSKLERYADGVLRVVREVG